MSRVVRAQLKYSEKEIAEIKEELHDAIHEFKKINDIYDNQKQIGKIIYKNFIDKTIIAQLVIGKTQSGKTGAMFSIIYEYILNNVIPLDNIFIITGLSDCGWKEQTKARFPLCVRNIYHQNDIKKIINKLRDLNNVLIIIDETHIASSDKQTLSKIFVECDLHTKTKMMKRDIKIVEFSATPDGVVYDIKKNWSENCRIEFLEQGDGYIGVKELKDAGRLFQYEKLFPVKSKTKQCKITEDVLLWLFTSRTRRFDKQQ